MDYSLLVGIHRCSDSADATDGALPETNFCDASAGVYVIKSSAGTCFSFFLFVLY